MKLNIQGLPLEDTWKDIVRVNKKYREDRNGKLISRGTICRISVGERSKWVVAHGREVSDEVIQMDLNVRLALKVQTNTTQDVILDRISWFRSLWFPWKASDPIYRLPAQLGLISFFLGLILGLLGIFIPFYLEAHKKSFESQSHKATAALVNINTMGTRERSNGCRT